MDTTIICTVTDNTDKKNGNYWVTDGAAKFIAKTDANSRYYNVGDTVRVLAIKGDLGNCYISGKYSQNTTDNPLTYIPPTETVVSMTDNLIPSKIDAWGITANSSETQKCLWSINLTNSDYKDLQTNSIYDTISLRADFKCLLANYRMKAGTYGLILRLGVRSTSDNSKLTSQWVSLDSTDMFGNPYSFLLYSTQEATFDISELGTIENMSLWLYQNEDFKYYKDNGIIEDVPVTDFNNILVKNIYLSFGSDLTKIEDNTLQIYTGDNIIYNANEDSSNLRDIGLLWYNKDENNTYIGFSDGIFDPEYDEITYLNDSEVDDRLAAQLGKDIPTDEAGLKISADLEESQPILKNLRNSVTRDMRNNIYGFEQQILSISQAVSDIHSKFEQVLDLTISCGQDLEEYQKIMNEQYIELLSVARGIQDTNDLLVRPEFDEEIDYFDIKSKIEYLLHFVHALLDSVKREIKDNYSGFMSIYDTYETRIKKVETTMLVYLNQLKDLLADDKGILDRYFEMDYNFIPYIKEDFSSYANKYCIYWYRYEPGYYDITERFMEKGWHRLPDKNLGLPKEPLKEDSLYNAKKPLSPEGILTRDLDTQYLEEKYIALLFYNHTMYKSNILTFTNENPPVDEKTADLADACKIEHSDNSQPSYQVYGLNNLLVNAADGYRKRKILLRYDGLNAGDEALYGAQIFWYIPKNATMLKYELEDFDNSWSNDADADPTVNSSYAKEGYVCFYKTIGGTETPDGRVEINNEDRCFIYRIRDYYSQTFTKNTIYCRIVKPNYYDYKAEISFVFSSFGTSGTDYSLVISPNTAKAAADYNVEDGANLSLGIALYDYDNKRLKILDTAPAPDNFDPYLDSPLEWIGPSGYNATFLDEGGEYGVEKIKITVNGTAGPREGYFNGILKATVPYMIDELNKLVELIAVYPIPYSVGDYYIEGPSVVVYNSDGINPTYYKNPFKIFKREDDSELTSVTWEMRYYDEDGNIITPTQWGEDEYAILQGYMPKIDNNNCLVPCHMYLENNSSNIGTEAHPVAICKDDDGVIIWAQPIYCMKNRYASAMINQWDGSLQIDEENGTILSTMVGAGRKNSKNQFEGILLGDVGSASEDNATGVGLYGFHEGAQSFNFNVDGTAFIGKSGRGRIKFNGNKGTITSASYEQTDESAGMMIDLDDGVIDMKGAKIDTTSGAYVANTSTNIHIDVKSPYFTIDSEKGNRIIHIGSDRYELKSDEYIETDFKFNEIESNDGKSDEKNVQGQGMLIDLKAGKMDAFDFQLSSKNIYLNSKETSKPYFAIKDNDNNMLMYIGANKYWLKSADYSEDAAGNAEKGMKINLVDGKIDAFNFSLVSERVTLSTDGTITKPYLEIIGENDSGEDISLMHISKAEQFIRSLNYSDETASSAGTGMEINLGTGDFTAYDFNLKAGSAVKNQGQLRIESEALEYPLWIGTIEQEYDPEKPDSELVPNFKVDWAGNFYAQGGKFTGAINATSGYLGNLTVGGRLTGGTIEGAILKAGGWNGSYWQLEANKSQVVIRNALIYNSQILNGDGADTGIGGFGVTSDGYMTGFGAMLSEGIFKNCFVTGTLTVGGADGEAGVINMLGNQLKFGDGAYLQFNDNSLTCSSSFYVNGTLLRTKELACNTLSGSVYTGAGEGGDIQVNANLNANGKSIIATVVTVKGTLWIGDVSLDTYLETFLENKQVITASNKDNYTFKPISHDHSNTSHSHYVSGAPGWSNNASMELSGPYY